MTLQQRLAEPRVLLCPGVYDALSALIAEQAGFEALYLSGASMAYTRLGRSDIGLTTFSEVQDTLAHITERVRTHVPVLVRHGSTELSAGGIDYDNATQRLEFNAPVHATLTPRAAKVVKAANNAGPAAGKEGR